jgi:hypothetical protein
MDTSTKVRWLQEGGKLASDVLRVLLNRPAKRVSTTGEVAAEMNAAPSGTSTIFQKVEASKIEPQRAAAVSLPTREETTQELKRRLARELYRAELDLAGGLRIAGKPCDCLDNKHILGLEATAEELISQEPSNPVYTEIMQWTKENSPKVTIEAISGGRYAAEYPRMASHFKDFRKRVLGTAAFSAMGESPQTITLEEAKKLAADEAEKEVERQWHSVEKK